jgi:hypothetical protein
MIDALRLSLGWALVWGFGIAVLAATTRPSALERPGERAWLAGCGFFVGAFLVTVWMRGLSLAGVRFSLASIGVPIAAATFALAWLGWKRLRAKSAQREPMTRNERVLVTALAAWLAFRFIVLLLDVIWTPLYPWDAWIQWATKSRVWYELGRIVPFGRSEAWFAANGLIWFDASPNYPATVPLWQVWSSVALARFDDALMNLPWWLTAVAFAIAVFGFLRGAGFGIGGAWIGTWLVSSLPLANVHVALAGYADLPMAAYFALAALALWRWSSRRTLEDAMLAAVLAVACTTIKTPGIVWALCLVPGVILATMPRFGPRIVGFGLFAALLTLAVLAQTSPVVLGYRLHLDFAPAWQALADSLFLLGNWHLLWYAAIAVAIVAWRDVRSPALAPLAIVLAAGIVFLLVAFSFTNARNWVTEQTTVNRAVLHIAPLVLVFTLLAVRAWFARRTASTAVDPVATAA